MGVISYDNTTLVSDEISEVPSRDNCDTSVIALNNRFSIPMVSAPMSDVCNGEMARSLAILGGLAIIHRYQSIESQVYQYSTVAIGKKTTAWLGDSNPTAIGRIACAIGVTDDYIERFIALREVGCEIFCLDTANGANTQVGAAISRIRANTTFNAYGPFIIAGNVATACGYQYLSDAGANAVRVGIAGGSVCETKTETGIHLPTLESVRLCEYHRENIMGGRGALIIADGGIRIPADMHKALAVGADMVMCGSIFAGTKESPGEVVSIDGALYKIYRGAASYGVQKETKGRKPAYVEGRETVVPFKNIPVSEVVDRFSGGLRSCMSYANALTLDEFRRNIRVVEL